MNAASRLVRLRWAWGSLLLLGCACHQTFQPSTAKLPPLHMRLPSPPALGLVMPPSPRKSVDVLRLDLTDFIPPGAQRIGPSRPLPANLAPFNLKKFPLTDFAYSPDRSGVL